MKNIRKRIVTKEPGLAVQVTARELVSELMKPATVIASGKAVIDYLYTLPLSPAVCTKLVSMIGDHVLDAPNFPGVVDDVGRMEFDERVGIDEFVQRLRADGK